VLSTFWTFSPAVFSIDNKAIALKKFKNSPAISYCGLLMLFLNLLVASEDAFFILKVAALKYKGSQKQAENCIFL
jgi:hypothetical protein